MITGASVGIGEQFARQLAERGHDVVLVARDVARLEALAKEIESRSGAHAEVLAADLTDAAQLATVEARARTVDILVNNAGFGTFGPFHTLDLDTETREINLNVVALVRLTHAAAAAMAERGRGGILNVSSLAGFQPGPSNATYARDQGVRHVVHRGGARGAEGHGRVGDGAVPGLHAHRVPGARERARERRARLHVAGGARGRARRARRARQEPRRRRSPAPLNKVLGNLSAVTPHAITRRLSAVGA